MRLSGAVLFLLVSTSWAQDRLIPGPGSALTENKCNICHELQHIRRARLSRGEWADNLRNMKERGTPMTDAEMQVILEYLATYYNREKPAPAASVDSTAQSGTQLENLLNASGCTGCHALDQKVVGPAFREVARRYSPAQASALAQKIREGSQGTWGPVPMPPNTHVSAEDADRLANWVLQQK